jgi:hypothetical protein
MDANGKKKPKPELHKVEIIGLMGQDSSIGEKHVKVDCDCGFFWTRCEWVLKQHGAADIKHTNGEPPDIRNPSYKIMVCKHVARALMLIQQKGW